jgi:hypothetical protein
MGNALVREAVVLRVLLDKISPPLILKKPFEDLLRALELNAVIFQPIGGIFGKIKSVSVTTAVCSIHPKNVCVGGGGYVHIRSKLAGRACTRRALANGE